MNSWNIFTKPLNEKEPLVAFKQKLDSLMGKARIIKAYAKRNSLEISDYEAIQIALEIYKVDQSHELTNLDNKRR